MSSFDSEQDPADTVINAAPETTDAAPAAPEATEKSSSSGNGKIVAIAVGAVLLVAALIGAGLWFGGVFKSPADNPQKVVEKFVKSTTCDQVQKLMSEGLYAENFSSGPCTDAAIKQSFSMITLGGFKTTIKDNIAFVNSTATVTDATTKSTNKTPLTVNLVKVDNHWLVDHIYSKK